jgi:hypothetical protein
MKSPTLVVSNPPHEDVDVEAAADLLGLDVFAARLKSTFTAPEILGAAGPDGAVQLAVALRKSGFRVTILPGATLAALPWPDPVSHLTFDDACLRVYTGGRSLEIDYDTETVGVFCRPPEDYGRERPIDLGQAIASGHEPTIAEAIQQRGFIDLYCLLEDALRRVSIVPRMFGTEAEDVVRELDRRFRDLRLDRRLEGVRPRARFVRHDDEDTHPDALQRRGYSFGTERLSDLLWSIDPELSEMTQFELGSRISCSLDPPGAEGHEAL